MTIHEQLKKAKFPVEKINYVGISHFHPDHTGQVRYFLNAKLLIGAQDWDAIKSETPPRLVSVEDFTPWVFNKSEVVPIHRDLDVFGDGSVVILATPGHTLGHKSLLVRLPQAGNVILTGDLAHVRRNYQENLVPVFNTDRADTLASLERVKSMSKALEAVVIIQHDPDDVGKLAAFPKWTR